MTKSYITNDIRFFTDKVFHYQLWFSLILFRTNIKKLSTISIKIFKMLKKRYKIKKNNC